jgi:hypothetical protein
MTFATAFSDVVIKSADYASGQSDRWMFVVTLIIFLTAGAWMVRYFTAQVKEARAEYKILADKFTEHLMTAHTEMSVALKDNATVTARTNQLLGEVESTLREILGQKGRTP